MVPGLAICCAVLLAATAAAAGSLPEGRTAAPDGARPLPFLYDIYTFRGAGAGDTDVVAAFAVAAGDLEREPVPGGVRYRFDVSLVLADTARRTVVGRHDSVYVDLHRPLPDDHLLFTAIELRAAPSATTLRRVYMYDATLPGVGRLHIAPFRVPDYSGYGLMLSDVVLGQPDAPAGWRRGDVALALLPTRQFPASAFEVFYEIYNLPAGHRYRTTISIDELNEEGDAGAARPVVRLHFDGRGTAPDNGTIQELRRVESSLPRGHYRLTVDITDIDTGATARSGRTFEVHTTRRGTTIVPALPVTVTTAGHGAGTRQAGDRS